jgi:TRAP-type C4-dicarboxylate transport system substrate-binding protein
MKRFTRTALLLAVVLAAVSANAFSQTVRIKIGTMAPKDTLWHQVLQQMVQDWKKISNGQVTATIYTDGNQGDEVEMLRKARRGGLQAVALSSSGLAHADTGVSSLQIPMMLSSYEELDYVRDRMAPKLEALLAAKGLIVLNWVDVGWVHFFSKRPARTVNDIRQMKLFTSDGDPETEALYRELGFKPVPMAATDLLPNLQTGLIDAFDVPPLFALSGQSFGLAKNMIPVKWAPLVGATVITKDAWESIPAELRPKLLEASRAAGQRLRGDIRRQGDEAVTVMKKNGLQVSELDPATLASWQKEAESAYPKIRGRLVPADLFDEALRLRNEFRNKK